MSNICKAAGRSNTLFKRIVFVLMIIYTLVGVLCLVNGGWHGTDGASRIEWIMIVFSMPWIFVFALIPVMPAPDVSIFTGILWFSIIPFVMNAAIIYGFV